MKVSEKYAIWKPKEGTLFGSLVRQRWHCLEGNLKRSKLFYRLEVYPLLSRHVESNIC